MSLKKILSVIFVFAFMGHSFAQLNLNCPGCVVNAAAFGASPSASAVGLSPDSFVITQDDTVNIDVTYMMPQQLAVSGVTATVTEVQIIGIDGTAPLPNGLSITCDQTATSCAYYPQTYRFGCVKVCGRTSDPATGGWVAARIIVAGTGTALGQTETQDQDITVYYMILPDTSACHTVCFQNKVNSGCDSATIGIYGGIDLSCPDPILNPCSFNWAYGNGTTGSGLANTPVTYTSPGTYPVTLTAVTQELVITGASFTVPSGSFTCAILGGCPWYYNICNGDGINNSANDFSLSITNGSSTYNTSGAGGGNLSNTWTGLTDTITNQAVAITVSDACLLSTLTSSTATMTITGPGTFNWAAGTDATGSITVSLVTKDSATYTDSVYIYPSPDTPVIVASADSICQGDSVSLAIGSQYAGYTIQWFQDTIFLNNLTDTTVYVSSSGNYYCTVINPATHCRATSASVPVAVSSQVTTSATPTHYGSVVYLNPFIPGSIAQWYFDSTLVTGESGVSIPYLGAGTYYAVVYPSGFPQCAFTSPVITILPSGIAETDQDDVYNLSVFPNPNNGMFNVKVNVLTPGSVTIDLTDVLGRNVYENTLANQNGQVSDNINVSDLAKGVYTVEVTTDKGKATKRVVVE